MTDNLQKEVFLLEHGFYDEAVLQHANNSDNIKDSGDSYILWERDGMTVRHSNGVTGFYGETKLDRKNRLIEWRKKWFLSRHPEFKDESLMIQRYLILGKKIVKLNKTPKDVTIHLEDGGYIHISALVDDTGAPMVGLVILPEEPEKILEGEA